jgi:hypothetical protein
MSIALSLFLTALVLFAFELTKWALAVVAALVLWLFPTALFIALIALAAMGFVGLFVNRRR